MSNKVDTQVQFALNYVKENKYAYGPAYSSKNLVWNVEKIEESDSGVTRIYINYKVSEESQNYGSEYIDIDHENNILSRRQIKILREPKNSLIKQYQELFKLEGVKLTFNFYSA